MMSGVFSTVRAFFLGFALLSRDSAKGTLRAYRTHLLGTLMLGVYLAVMSYYFFHHGKAIPKEQTSDKMVLVFEYALAPVFYMGFQQLAVFLFREDVQRAFSRYVETAKYWLLFAWDRLTIAGATVWALTCAVLRVLMSFARATLRVTRYILGRAGHIAGAGFLIAIACSLEGFRNTRAWTKLRIQDMKRFATNCVEAGQSTRM